MKYCINFDYIKPSPKSLLFFYSIKAIYLAVLLFFSSNKIFPKKFTFLLKKAFNCDIISQYSGGFVSICIYDRKNKDFFLQSVW